MCFAIVHDCHIGMLQQQMQAHNRVVELNNRRSDLRACGAQGSHQRKNDLGDQPIQIRVGRTFEIKTAPAVVIQGFVIVYDGDIGMLQQRMHTQNRVV